MAMNRADSIVGNTGQQCSVQEIIRIGDLPIIRDSEIQNFCLHGTVGAGKSEVIRRLANYARQRGDMVVIYDRSSAVSSLSPSIVRRGCSRPGFMCSMSCQSGHSVVTS